MPDNKKRPRKPGKGGKSQVLRPKGRPGRKLGPKTLFVLSQPSDMPAADVVQSAARQGIRVTTALVHTIRSRHKGRSAPKDSLNPAASQAAGVPRGSHASNHSYASASAFVREQALNRPVKEVVEAARKVGLKVTANLVRIVRHKMRKAANGGPALGPGIRRGRPPASDRHVLLGTAEAQFRQLVFELGVNRAKNLVSEVDQAVRRLFAES
jgi:hypothetical protein